MKYAVIIYETGEDFAARTDESKAGEYWGAYKSYGNALREAGVMVANGVCLKAGHTATTIRLKDGKRFVQDGPFADTKEQLGGMIVIETPDLDAALAWAAKCPAAGKAVVEVRPLEPTTCSS